MKGFWGWAHVCATKLHSVRHILGSPISKLSYMWHPKCETEAEHAADDGKPWCVGFYRGSSLQGFFGRSSLCRGFPGRNAEEDRALLGRHCAVRGAGGLVPVRSIPGLEV